MRSRLPVIVAVLASVGVCTAGAASAATPNNQACLGKDFSGYAQAGGANFGHFNASLAQSVPGLGLPIQVHLAGYIPDWYIENSCND
jgi:hypothetical protein